MGAHAMQHHEGHRDPAKIIEHMQKKLGLSDQQVAQIKDIYAKNEATMKTDRDAIKAAAKIPLRRISVFTFMGLICVVLEEIRMDVIGNFAGFIESQL